MPAPPLDEEAIFNAAVECGSAESRSAYLDGVCGGDADLRRRVEALLRLRGTHESFLAEPAVLLLGEAEPATALDVDASGSVVGRYRLLERIGEGGFGAVYLAEQTEPVKRRVALKVIKAGMDTRQVIARFEAERQALAMMDHPNIAKVLDAGATEAGSPLGPGRPYFVMELVKGVPITRFCDDERLVLRERLALFMDACQAVQHAHQKGIIHRDLKPSNVLVSRYDEKPVVKIIDFGIAKATGGSTGGLTDKTLFTEFRQLIGTPAYMSPEQAGLSDLDIDTRSDVYALGVLLYELLTGTTPFEAARLRSAGFDEMRRIIREEEPPKPSTRLSRANGDSAALASCRRTDPRSLVRSLHGDLDWIAMKALEKDRARRYDTAAGLCQDVERYLKHEPVVAGPPSRVYRARKFVRRNRALVTGTTLVVCALLAGLAGTTFGLMRAEQRRIEAEKATKLAERREKETRQVADFQATMLSGIDVEKMGRGIKEEFRKQVRASLGRRYVGEGAERRPRTPQEVEAEVAAFDRRADAAHAVDVARGVLARFVLVPAAESLDKQFADQPLVRAQLHDAIGRTYAALGLHAAADPHLGRALEIRQAELGEGDQRVGDSLWELASLRFDQGDFAAAELLLRRALDVYRRVAAESGDVAAVLDMLAGLHHQKGEDAEAERLIRDALEMRRKLFGEGDAVVALNMSNLACLLRDRGDYAAAEAMFTETLVIHRQAPEPSADWTAATLNHLANLLWKRREYDAAIPLSREALDIRRSQHGNDHPVVAEAMHNLACVLTDRGDHSEAEALLTQALPVFREAHGPDDTRVIETLERLGRLFMMRGDCSAATRSFREALAVREETAEPDSPGYWQLFDTRGMLGGALAGEGAALIASEPAAAMALFAEAEPLLVGAGEWLTQHFDRIPQRVRAARLKDAVERVVRLYETWHTVAPDGERTARAARWRAELDKLPGP